jgi:hypothetical protein
MKNRSINVKVTVNEITLDDDNGNEICGISVSCSRCGYQVEVFGTSERSVTRGCVMLREQCPQNQKNFYGIR